MQQIRRVLALYLLLQTGFATAQATQTSEAIDRADYARKLHGFWLGQSIANWTGLITEMDRVEPPFYSDEDWGSTDQPNIWGAFVNHSSRIDFYLPELDRVWGSDDDTDIEYMYWQLAEASGSPELTAEQIREGWLRHIYSNENAPISPTEFRRENYLWVSNERAFYLMRDKGLLPPATSAPSNNPDFAMIDAQLTTESFGLMAPGRPQTALNLAALPIAVTASGEAAAIARFYVVMHAAAANLNDKENLATQLQAIAALAAEQLPVSGYARDMYEFVLEAYTTNPDKNDWEQTRHAIYQRYQINGEGGYQYSRPFDAGINFAASLISLFYGEGDFRRTVQIASLAGWDSDNPAATWGGLLGFILGKDGIERTFQRRFSEAYWIHRTRKAFPDHTPGLAGEDTFSQMAQRGVDVVEKVLTAEE
ncbi:ADP-ribosylglycohydrolase family protein [Luminiphilus sp. nBUS_07]|uniref:ADP-ribosylglycohydrolase family protein n=1 Tax=Luminiphilus sp. nBUS_07 TaxID=3395314 RepID=UPI003EBBCA3E